MIYSMPKAKSTTEGRAAANEETPASKRQTSLTAENRAESRRLKALFEEFQKRSKPRISQGKFGLDHGIGTQGFVWQCINGRIAMNVEHAVKWAEALGRSVEDFSPRLARELEERASAAHYASERAPLYISDPLERELIETFRKLSPKGQNQVLGNATRQLSSERNSNGPPPIRLVKSKSSWPA